jgi:type I restriction enzyme M protein
LEGLEVTVVLLSDFRVGNDSLRLDSEFSDKAALRVVNQLKSAGAEQFGESDPEILHPHEITRQYVEVDGVWFFRAQNLRPFLIEDDDKVFISDEDSKALARNELINGDVVITRTGANAGDCALFSSPTRGFASSHTFIVRSMRWNHAFLVAYLNSSYGRCQILRARYGAAQPEVAPYYLRGIWIPQVGPSFQDAVARLFDRAIEKRDDSKNLARAAEQTLLQALGLKNWHPPEPLTYTRRACEALSAARFDAEFFQPKFAALIAKMKENDEVVRLGDCLRFCERGRQPAYAEEGLPVINSRHVRTNNVVLDEDNRFATEEAAQLLLDEEDRFTIKQGDLLINGTGVGTMGRCAPYLREDKALPDNHVTILRMKPDVGLDPIFLSIQLNSIIGQMQVDQYFKGSSGQIELYPGDIKEFRIWLAPQKIQQQISSHLEQTHAARQQAQALLAKAKRAVEVAIEEGEDKAMKLLASG